MKARLARTAGFCMGVRRAMELALERAHGQDRPIYTYGPLIHNPQVLDLLRSKGIGVLEEIPPPGSQEGGVVIIRAHGVPPEDKRRLKEAGFHQVVEGTCPRVLRVQALIRRATRHGGWAVIVGDPEHPEVVGLLGHARGRGRVVSSPEQVAGLPPMEHIVVVAQTTQSEEVFQRVVRALQERFGPVEVNNTICEATHRRQEEVRRLAREVDCMVVVGGRQSGNTKRLAQIAQAQGTPVFLVENEKELDHQRMSARGVVGVTAGASTPNWMIKRVLREISFIRPARGIGLGFWARRVFRFLVFSQLLVALGAAGMTVAASLLQGLSPHVTLVGAAFCYIYAMHVLNQFLDKEAGQYNDPDRGQFLVKHRLFMVGTGVLAAGTSLVLCARLGPLPLALVSVMSVMGLMYSVPMLPPFLQRRTGIQRLKDIPGSKTLSAGLAWAAVAAVLPAAAHGLANPAGLVLGFAYTLVLVLVRCALFDILDVQGDLIVGKETIPIMLGEARTRRLLWWSTALLAAVMLLAPLPGLVPGLAWVLCLPLAGVAAMEVVLARAWMLPGSLSEGLVDLNFSLAGVLALVWHYW